MKSLSPSDLGLPEELFAQRDKQGRLTSPGLVDHRALIMAREAMSYRELMAKAKEAAKKVSAAPQRTVAPDGGSTAIDKRGAQFQQLKKTGSPRDAAHLMANFV